jgi:membrane-bound lytic murein transglycosylase D
MKLLMRWIHRPSVTVAASLLALLGLARASYEPVNVIAQPREQIRQETESGAPRQADPEAFPRYPDLEPSIEFWTNVFTRWSETDVVFHDRDDLSIIYRKIRQPVSDTPELYRRNEAAQEAIMERIHDILLDLAERNPDPRTLSGDYEDVYEAFDGKGSPARWRQAADRIRVQRGIKEKFFAGLVHAGQYRPYILEIMREEGVPEEIAWLPLVESTFNLQARSSVGAAGVWQFMPGTGKLFMRVDATVDERLDPILAARGAARLLKQNYRGLRSWPLALTAYNHGYYGMQRAVREVGTNDYMTVRRFYEGPAFGFASKNFYPEFLAAVEIAENPERYFGVHEPLQKLEFDRVTVPTSLALADIASAVQVDAARLWQLNPSLTDAVYRGQRNVPAGFVLRVPPGYGREAPMQLASAVAGRSGLRTRSGETGDDAARARFYTVRRGDTLSSIAARHGMSVSELAALNDLRNSNHIRVGQRLRLAR